MLSKHLLAALCLGLVAGCSVAGPISGRQATPVAETLPEMRWEHRTESDEWTKAALEALDGHGRALVETDPADITRYCPGYKDASEEDRQAFWAGLISSLAKHESTWRPEAVGGGGRWFGLTQISPATARGYGCKARSGDALKNGEDNISCAIRIMAVTVPRDGVVSAGGKGVAADWGPFHSSRKREDIAAWTRSQAFCSPKA